MTSKLNLRPVLEIQTPETSSKIEKFQNQTLRPILKLQNDSYLKFFENFAINRKKDFKTLSTEKKMIFMEQSLQKEVTLKNTFIGITIGMLTAEELENYLLEIKSYNKRIITMLAERLKSQMK